MGSVNAYNSEVVVNSGIEVSDNTAVETSVADISDIKSSIKDKLGDARILSEEQKAQFNADILTAVRGKISDALYEQVKKMLDTDKAARIYNAFDKIESGVWKKTALDRGVLISYLVQKIESLESEQGETPAQYDVTEVINNALAPLDNLLKKVEDVTLKLNAFRVSVESGKYHASYEEDLQEIEGLIGSIVISEEHDLIKRASNEWESHLAMRLKDIKKLYGAINQKKEVEKAKQTLQELKEGIIKVLPEEITNESNDAEIIKCIEGLVEDSEKFIEVMEKIKEAGFDDFDNFFAHYEKLRKESNEPYPHQDEYDTIKNLFDELKSILGTSNDQDVLDKIREIQKHSEEWKDVQTLLEGTEFDEVKGLLSAYKELVISIERQENKFNRYRDAAKSVQVQKKALEKELKIAQSELATLRSEQGESDDVSSLEEEITRLESFIAAVSQFNDLFLDLSKELEGEKLTNINLESVHVKLQAIDALVRGIFDEYPQATNEVTTGPNAEKMQAMYNVVASMRTAADIMRRVVKTLATYKEQQIKNDQELEGLRATKTVIIKLLDAGDDLSDDKIEEILDNLKEDSKNYKEAHVLLVEKGIITEEKTVKEGIVALLGRIETIANENEKLAKNLEDAVFARDAFEKRGDMYKELYQDLLVEKEKIAGELGLGKDTPVDKIIEKIIEVKRTEDSQWENFVAFIKEEYDIVIVTEEDAKQFIMGFEKKLEKLNSQLLTVVIDKKIGIEIAKIFAEKNKKGESITVDEAIAEFIAKRNYIFADMINDGVQIHEDFFTNAVNEWKERYKNVEANYKQALHSISKLRNGFDGLTLSDAIQQVLRGSDEVKRTQLEESIATVDDYSQGKVSVDAAKAEVNNVFNLVGIKGEDIVANLDTIQALLNSQYDAPVTENMMKMCFDSLLAQAKRGVKLHESDVSKDKEVHEEQEEASSNSYSKLKEEIAMLRREIQAMKNILHGETAANDNRQWGDINIGAYGEGRSAIGGGMPMIPYTYPYCLRENPSFWTSVKSTFSRTPNITIYQGDFHGVVPNKKGVVKSVSGTMKGVGDRVKSWWPWKGEKVANDQGVNGDTANAVNDTMIHQGDFSEKQEQLPQQGDVVTAESVVDTDGEDVSTVSAAETKTVSAEVSSSEELSENVEEDLETYIKNLKERAGELGGKSKDIKVALDNLQEQVEGKDFSGDELAELIDRLTDMEEIIAREEQKIQSSNKEQGKERKGSPDGTIVGMLEGESAKKIESKKVSERLKAIAKHVRKHALAYSLGTAAAYGVGDYVFDGPITTSLSESIYGKELVHQNGRESSIPGPEERPMQKPSTPTQETPTNVAQPLSAEVKVEYPKAYNLDVSRGAGQYNLLDEMPDFVKNDSIRFQDMSLVSVNHLEDNDGQLDVAEDNRSFTMRNKTLENITRVYERSTGGNYYLVEGEIDGEKVMIQFNSNHLVN